MSGASGVVYSLRPFDGASLAALQSLLAHRAPELTSAPGDRAWEYAAAGSTIRVAVEDLSPPPPGSVDELAAIGMKLRPDCFRVVVSSASRSDWVVNEIAGVCREIADGIGGVSVEPTHT